MKGKNWYLVYYATQYRTLMYHCIVHFDEETTMNHELATQKAREYHLSQLSERDREIAEKAKRFQAGELIITPLSWAIENE